MPIGKETLSLKPSNEVRRERLKPTLRPLQVASLALGCVIGFGAFVLPGDFLGMAGPLGAVLGVAIGGAAMIVITRSYGLMVETLPVAGGEFAYAYRLGGRYHAFICGWLLTLGYLCIVPLNATALAVLGKFISPELFARGYLYSIAGFDVFAGEVLLASAAIVTVGYLQQRGGRSVGVLQLVMTATLVTAVVAIGVGTGTSPGIALSNLDPLFPPEGTPWGAVLSIVAISPWLYVGFDTLPQAAEEFDFSPRQGRRLMGGAVIAGAVMYIVVIIATAIVVPWSELLASGTTWATGTTVRISSGTVGLVFLTVAVCMAILTGINGFFLASSRLLFSMGRAEVLPAWFATLHPIRRTPTNALVFTGVVSLIAPWMGREVILWVVDMSSVGTSVGYFYACAAAFVVARDLEASQLATRIRIYAALGALLSAGFLVLLCVPGMPAFMALPSWIALAAWVALGTVFFLTRASRLRLASSKELDYLILGDDETGAGPTRIRDREI